METVINGIKTHFIDVGSTEGMPIVFLHGMTFDHQMWNPQIERLKDEYRVVAYDFRGHGKTEAGDGQFTYRHLVDDLVGLLDHLEIERAVLCGLSMGGAISELYGRSGAGPSQKSQSRPSGTGSSGK